MNPKINENISKTLGLEPLKPVATQVPVKIDEKKEIVLVEPVQVLNDETVDADYQQARENFQSIIDSATEAIAKLSAVASESESPRAFEVLANLLKTATESNKELLNLSKTRKEIGRTNAPQPATTQNETPIQVNNAVFIGSTQDLAKMIKEKSSIIDVQEVDSGNNNTINSSK